LVLAVLAGCQRETPRDVGLDPPVGADVRLGTEVDIDLGQWLKQPRAKLAEQAENGYRFVREHLDSIQSNKQSVDFLPQVLPPLVVPVFHQAMFHQKSGISLPPYASPDKKDVGLARHLLRYGDREGAILLSPDGLRAEMKSGRGEPNYPVEWTRLVGLTFISAQLKLAQGEVNAATELASLHRQLTKVIDPETQKGPLGATLLSMGRQALTKASAAWRSATPPRAALADDIDQFLKDWGPVPESETALPFGTDASRVGELLALPQEGKAFIANTLTEVARAVDLIGLPFAPDGLQVLAVFLDSGNRLAEWQLAFQPKIENLYRTPAHLAFRLIESGYEAQSGSQSSNLQRQLFLSPQTKVDVIRSNTSPALGAMVRILPAKAGPPPAMSRNLRLFGPVDLDLGYEANRRLVSPNQAGPMLTIRSPEILREMGDVLKTSLPEFVLLQRDPQLPLLSGLEMAWSAPETIHVLDRLLPSLWDDFGPGQLEEINEQTGSYLAFSWKDANTLAQLRLAFDERGPVFSLRDMQPSSRLPQRVARAQIKEESQRLERLNSAKYVEFLERSPGLIHEGEVGSLSLGMLRKAAMGKFPAGKRYLLSDVPGGVSLMILADEKISNEPRPRQVLVRFQDDRIQEIRIRFEPSPRRDPKRSELLRVLSEGKAGEPERIQPGMWEGFWRDLPNSGRMSSYRWSDDRTERLLTEGPTVSEVVWRDRPTQPGQAVPGPWSFLPTGISGCRLGDTRELVEEKWNEPAARSRDAEVYRLPSSNPYEMALVWYENER
ncbi:MAG: hypothetical protein ACKO23_06780, partial [Gemmataceae bacterium]